MEVENSKISKTIKVEVEKAKETTPFMTATAANTIREIVRMANEYQIKRESIVSLLKENGQFVLIFYK